MLGTLKIPNFTKFGLAMTNPTAHCLTEPGSGWWSDWQ